MSWIKELIIQRRTMFSPLIIVETDDKQRIKQLLSKKPEIIPLDDKTQWYLLDGYEGFSKIEGNRLQQIESAKEWGEITPPILAKITDVLKSSKSVVVIRNILRFNDSINAALLNWATNDEILDANSTVILFVDSRTELPRAIWNNAKIIKVTRSTFEERINAIKNAGFENVNGNEELVRSAATILAGLNLDQIDAALTELYIRKLGKLDLQYLADIKRKMLTKDPVVSIIESKYGFEAVGGYHKLKKLLYEQFILPLKYPQYAEKYGIDPPRGMILFGPPGTGKTLLVKTMGKELNRTVLKLQPENIFSKWVGETEKQLRKFFDIADAIQQAIIFIDEIDRYGKRATSSVGGGAEVRKEVFSMLLEELGREDRQWFFVAATNIIEAIDPAMLRTGRVDAVVPMPYPDFDARIEILKIHSQLKRNLPLAKDVDFAKIAEKTQYWSGSDLEQLVIRTARETMKKAIMNGERKSGKIRRITQDDFEEEIRNFKIDIERNKKMHERMKELAQQFTNDARLLSIFEETASKLETKTRIERLKKLRGGDYP